VFLLRAAAALALLAGSHQEMATNGRRAGTNAITGQRCSNNYIKLNIV
jgi:hypothetical protein